MARRHRFLIVPRLAILAAAFVIFLVAAASAQTPDYARSGFYLGVGGSVAFDVAAEHELDKLVGLSIADADTALGINGRGPLIPEFGKLNFF